MATKRKRIPRYGTAEINGHTYYRTMVTDSEGNRISLYGKTREDLYDKEMAALEQIDNARFRRKSPTVRESILDSRFSLYEESCWAVSM